MKRLMENWQRFINEEFEGEEKDKGPKYDPTYNLYLFEFTADCTISKSKGGDKDETLSEFRAIPDVTIIRQVPNTSNEDEEFYYSTVSVRFKSSVQDPKLKIHEITNALRRIKGVQTVTYNGDLSPVENKKKNR